MRSWIQTASGKCIYPLEPFREFGSINIEDIAHALSLLCRYNGHCRDKNGNPILYSVAEHSVLVANILPIECRLHGLLHDASEAYLGDISSPIKTEDNRAHETVMLRAIYRALEIKEPDNLCKELVHEADVAVLAAEKQQVMTTPPKPWDEPYRSAIPAPVVIMGTQPAVAKARFLNLYRILRKRAR